MAEQEKKRLSATKAAIAKFREEHPMYTDGYLIASVESIFPNMYEDNLEVALAVVKELYRRQEDWNDETFTSLLYEMTDGRKLLSYTIEERERKRVWVKVNSFIERLYHEAQERTIYLSECPEYKDIDVKQYFDELYSGQGKTLAQKFFTVLNNRALKDTNQISGFVLPFHCYTEPNGDVIFTKKKRSQDEYGSGSDNSGCLGVLLVAFIISLFVF